MLCCNYDLYFSNQKLVGTYLYSFYKVIPIGFYLFASRYSLLTLYVSRRISDLYLYNGNTYLNLMKYSLLQVAISCTNGGSKGYCVSFYHPMAYLRKGGDKGIIPPKGDYFRAGGISNSPTGIRDNW